jgi:hypothetical protein
MATEADTCRKFVVPNRKLQAKPAGWDSDPHAIAEQCRFTGGRVLVRGPSIEVFQQVADRVIDLQSTLPDVLKVRPVSDHGNANEIIGKSSGVDHLRNAINQLKSLVYAA